MNPDPKIYRLRSECLGDLHQLLTAMPPQEHVNVILTRRAGYPDVLCTITVNNRDLEWMRDACRQVSDGHVMLQTLAPAAEYTGERNYDLQ